MTGCATSRSEIKLQSPAIVAPATTATGAQPVIVIGKITDERVFEDGSDDPSTPSLGFGGVGKATDDVKAQAIARKRNTYGKALGDVLLQQGQTVESVIRENLTAAFQQAGYQVKDAGDAGPSPLVVDVHIKQFWAWFTPGFFAITLSDNIATDLVFNGAGAPVVVSTHVEDKHAVATDDDWIGIVGKGLDAYRAEVLHRMQGGEGAQIVATAANAVPVPSTGAVATPPQPAQPMTEANSAAPASSPMSATSEVPATAPEPTAAAVPAVPAAPIASSTADASTASMAMAQDAATQIGCGAVQANGGSTFVAACGSYSVLIDCDGGQCRPMHTIKGKDND
ncbi:hypothetical protein GCM10011408_27870 [Dyella caseinilytica]|nr:hypothetical protein GCM10011408_27870 [Dyella caseinilytica]